ncbi:Cof-type HAD-IIB family hydrolase [Camelliibacillus cellulosilyticus]|uniref:Cof-type HAD-IIB family hydrolase n=1 Tax=Camelliibacillus cellulosilyticus TaxID=2174486 RepID=A0ABV9GL59_9BACL
MKLIAIDLDGTLLSKQGTISKENIAAIHDAQRQGQIVAICSGRSLHDTKNILQNAGIECPIITGNGAIAYHGKECLQKLILPPQVMDELLPMLEEKGLYFELYTNQGIHLLKNGKAQLEEEIHRLKANDSSFPVEWATKEKDIQFGQYGLHFINDYRHLNMTEMDVYKIFILSFDRKKLQQLETLLGERQDLSITSSGWYKLEVAHPKASKGNALTLMAKHLNIPLKNTVAIGDNLNDLSMFRIAGMSIAMGNALEEVKAHSTYTTKNYHEDGVAYALRHYIMGS